MEPAAATEDSASEGSDDWTPRKASATQKWKDKVNVLRNMRRMSLGQLPNPGAEELDEEYESSMGTSAIAYEDALRFALEYSLPTEIVISTRKLFGRYDKSRTGELLSEEIQHVLREMYKQLHPSCSILPESLLAVPSPFGAAKFTEVLRWLSRASRGDVDNSASREHLRARDLARQWEVPIAEVEDIKELFDRFDANKSGSLDESDFKNALPVILKAPKGVEVPASRLRFYWKEIDTTRSGKVEFEQFFKWYHRSGFDDSSTSSGSCMVRSNISRHLTNGSSRSNGLSHA